MSTATYCQASRQKHSKFSIRYLNGTCWAGTKIPKGNTSYGCNDIKNNYREKKIAVKYGVRDTRHLLCIRHFFQTAAEFRAFIIRSNGSNFFFAQTQTQTCQKPFHTVHPFRWLINQKNHSINIFVYSSPNHRIQSPIQ